MVEPLRSRDGRAGGTSEARMGVGLIGQSIDCDCRPLCVSDRARDHPPGANTFKYCYKITYRSLCEQLYPVYTSGSSL